MTILIGKVQEKIAGRCKGKSLMIEKNGPLFTAMKKRRSASGSPDRWVPGNHAADRFAPQIRQAPGQIHTWTISSLPDSIRVPSIGIEFSGFFSCTACDWACWAKKVSSTVSIDLDPGTKAQTAAVGGYSWPSAATITGGYARCISFKQGKQKSIWT